MKKLITFGFALLIGAAVHAANENFKVPLDIGNIPDPGLRSAGVNNVILVNSTSPALATDADGTTITKGFIHFVIVPSSPTVVETQSHFIVFRDTDTANLTSTKLLPYLWAVNRGTATTGIASPSQMIKIDPPIPFYNGLSLNLGPAATTPVSGYEFAVGLRKAMSQ